VNWFLNKNHKNYFVSRTDESNVYLDRVIEVILTREDRIPSGNAATLLFSATMLS